jgi:hypothetical protein
MRENMKNTSLCTLLCLLLTSCSYFNAHHRHPAEEPILQTQDEVLQVFEFRSSAITYPGQDYRKTILNYIKTNYLFNRESVSVEFIEDATLPKGIAYFPEFQVKDNIYKMTILHSKEGIIDPVASAELVNFLRTLQDQKIFMSYFAAFEMYYNALDQDPIAAQNWAKVREIAAQKSTVNEFSDVNITEALRIRGVEWTKEKEDYLEKYKQETKQDKLLEKFRKAEIDILDESPSGQQFKNLVAKNDRSGVAELLKKYLPWNEMAPFEKKYWENYLDCIEHPLPMEKRVLIYRGLKDDFIYSAYQNGKELDKEIAQKDGKIFIMSTMMTKNQGTWNRRLRSLKAMNKKFIGTNSQLDDQYTQSARIITMFVNHSIEPQGSPFLSFTPKFSTAYNFGPNKMSAYALDPRILSFNFASRYHTEVEFLLPLIAFPEDLAAFYDSNFHPGVSNNEEQMKIIFKNKLVKEYGLEKAEDTYQKILNNSKSYFDSVSTRFTSVTDNKNPSSSNIIATLFNNLFKKKVITPPVVIPSGDDMTCIDILSSFWK